MEIREPVGADNQLSFSVFPKFKGKFFQRRWADIEEDGMVTGFYSFTRPGNVESLATGFNSLIKSVAPFPPDQNVQSI